MEPKIGIITQARMTSTRLPGKVLLPIGDTDLLSCHIRRLGWSRQNIILATTVNQTDDPLIKKCQELKLKYFRGSEHDVLSRFYFTALENKLDVIVRVTSDCPFIDRYLIAEGLRVYQSLGNSRAYLSNGMERSFPRGFDFEIFSFELLEEAQKNATSSMEREHVTPYMYLGDHKRILKHHFKRSTDASRYRLTVDEPKDYELIKLLSDKFGAEEKTAEELIEIMEKNRELAEINLGVEQKKLAGGES